MRPRTAIAAGTLAFLTLVWTAPAAFAADDDNSGGATSTAPAPASRGGQSDSDGNSGGSHSSSRSDNDGGGGSNDSGGSGTGGGSGGSGTGGGFGGGGRHEEPPTPPTTTPTSSAEPAPGNQAPQITVPEPRASLSVTPKTVRPGDTVTANATCQPGHQVSLVGSGVAFNGNTARIGDGTPNGAQTVTLTCQNGTKQATATDSFTVTHEPRGGPLKAQLAVSPGTVRPGDRIRSGAFCQNGRLRSLTADDVRFVGTDGTVNENAGDGDHTVTLVCENGDTTDTATGHFRVDRNGRPGGPGDSEGRATLKVSPRVVRQGDFIYANGGCENGRQDALFGDDVVFRGDRGWVADNAREGEHRVTRVCLIGPPPGPGPGPRPQYLKRVEVTDSFRVMRGDGPGDGAGPRHFWLSDRSGYRGDAVDVSVRCRDNRARLDSDVLDDITLRRDGSRLTGTTRVRGQADEGWHRVTVSCDGNRQSTGFWLLRERADHERYLDLDPAFGHPGDAIDVHVGCDSRLDELDSDVLDDIDLDHDGRPWRYEGTTHVREDAEPGEHTARIRCGGDTLDVDFFVQEEGDHGGDNGDSPGGGNDVKVYPKGAPETGGGPVGDAAALGMIGLTGAIGSGPTPSGSQGSARRRQR